MQVQIAAAGAICPAKVGAPTPRPQRDASHFSDLNRDGLVKALNGGSERAGSF